ncbi:hypothetical protein FACS189434_10240 [Bacteroidia bacterium]|nr:hypothetical protein FACS189434_10240 [Bacteroidia bacterium]
MAEIKIFVEGIADKKFLEDYINHILPNAGISNQTVIDTGGWTNIMSKKEKGGDIRNKMKENTDNDGINIVIFDADDNFVRRKQEIEQWKIDKNLSFELFLLPNNKEIGALEDLLEKIILDKNQPIFDCWNGYETCLTNCASKKIGKELTIPAKKTKIYGYLEALLGDTKKEKELIKERERNYKNVDHWNLNADYLQPLTDFLLQHIKL